MAQRSLNKVQLIGNLTRDPELRYTPQGTAVCTLGLATNRSWVTEAGEKKEETEFHRIVAWNKLAELCSQLLFKGRRIYVEGRLQTRRWTGQDGNPRQTTETVIDEMMILDSRRAPGEEEGVSGEPTTEIKEELPPEEARAVQTTPVQVATEEKKEIPAEGKPPIKVKADTGKVIKKKGKKVEEVKEEKKEEEKEKVDVDDIPF